MRVDVQSRRKGDLDAEHFVYLYDNNPEVWEEVFGPYSDIDEAFAKKAELLGEPPPITLKSLKKELDELKEENRKLRKELENFLAATPDCNK